jgi:hypothetical protein
MAVAHGDLDAGVIAGASRLRSRVVPSPKVLPRSAFGPPEGTRPRAPRKSELHTRRHDSYAKAQQLSPPQDSDYVTP